MEALDQARRNRCEKLFREHVFPAPVVETNGWEFDGRSTYRRTVFLDNGHSRTNAVVFYVEFEAISNRVVCFGVR